MRHLTSATAILATAASLADRAAAITCTKSKNNGGILLYGNHNWNGGWLEVHRAGVGATSAFDLMFEMDCDDPTRTFDFEARHTSTGELEHAFFGQSVPSTHHLSSAIDHSIFRMASISLPTGVYTYGIRSVGETDWFNGTIKSLGDLDDPTFVTTPPEDLTAVQGTDTNVPISVEVVDDAVLDYLHVTANGDYVTRVGLKTSNYKVVTTTTARTVTVNIPIPPTGKTENQVVSLLLCDAVGRCAFPEEVTIAVSKGGGGGGGDTTNSGCTLGQKGDYCQANGECCSGKCKGNNSCA